VRYYETRDFISPKAATYIIDRDQSYGILEESHCPFHNVTMLGVGTANLLTTLIELVELLIANAFLLLPRPHYPSPPKSDCRVSQSTFRFALIAVLSLITVHLER
jgi:hypothetical protein